MRWIPRLTNELVVVAVHSTHIACIWVQRAHNGYFSLRAYKQYQCTHHQVGHGILFNPSWIAHNVYTFLTQYHLQHAFVAFMPDNTSVTHGFVLTDTAHPESSIFKPYYMRHTHFDYEYIYPNERNQFLFYWYRIPQTLIFQYQLLSRLKHIYCIRITPQFCALLHAYRALHGAVFRSSQLGIDLTKHSNNITHYFNQDLIRRFVYCTDKKLYTDPIAALDIVASCGLLYCQKDIT